MSSFSTLFADYLREKELVEFLIVFWTVKTVVLEEQKEALESKNLCLETE